MVVVIDDVYELAGRLRWASISVEAAAVTTDSPAGGALSEAKVNNGHF